MEDKSYQELISIRSFEERLNYLRLSSRVSEEVYGSMRYLNQALYRSQEWRRVRRDVILRDKGCDLAMPGYEIYKGFYIHHINPITVDDIVNRSFKLFDLNNLVLSSYDTHELIHFGSDSRIQNRRIIERTPNDTCPWKG